MLIYEEFEELERIEFEKEEQEMFDKENKIYQEERNKILQQFSKIYDMMPSDDDHIMNHVLWRDMFDKYVYIYIKWIDHWKHWIDYDLNKCDEIRKSKIYEYYKNLPLR